MDTQWPRYEVFKQDNERKVHEAVGSVHAADAEMALLNARHVFVRRPSAVSLWVVPESAIYSRTAEELAAHPAPMDEPAPPNAHSQRYLIFTKDNQRRTMVFVRHVGEVTADSAAHALAQAIPQFGGEDVFAWWVIPASEITASPEGEETAASWFAPAEDKTYRQQSYYGFVGSRKSRARTADETYGTS